MLDCLSLMKIDAIQIITAVSVFIIPIAQTPVLRISTPDECIPKSQEQSFVCRASRVTFRIFTKYSGILRSLRLTQSRTGKYCQAN